MDAANTHRVTLVISQKMLAKIDSLVEWEREQEGCLQATRSQVMRKALARGLKSLQRVKAADRRHNRGMNRIP